MLKEEKIVKTDITNNNNNNIAATILSPASVISNHRSSRVIIPYSLESASLSTNFNTQSQISPLSSLALNTISYHCTPLTSHDLSYNNSSAAVADVKSKMHCKKDGKENWFSPYVSCIQQPFKGKRHSLDDENEERTKCSSTHRRSLVSDMNVEQQQYVNKINDALENSLTNTVKNVPKPLVPSFSVNVQHKPPLPPRIKADKVDNSRPVLPPSIYQRPKPPVKSLSVPGPTSSKENDLTLGNLAGSDFSFTFSKRLSPPKKQAYNYSSTFCTQLSESLCQPNLVNQTLADITNTFEDSLQGPLYLRRNYSSPSAFMGFKVKSSQPEVMKEQLDSTSVVSRSEGWNLRNNSLPRMGLSSRSTAKGPRPAPIPPPKKLPNVLAPLKSTELLDQSQLWVRG